MKYPVSLEFKEKITYSSTVVPVPGPFGVQGSLVPAIYDFPRLTTAYPRPGAPAGADRQICRTVNGAVRLEFLESTAPCRVLATACLMGAYGGSVGVIQEHTFGPALLGLETTGVISGNNPINNEDSNLYSTANMSAGAYGFDYFSSYSNLLDTIFIRIEIMRSGGEQPPSQVKFLVSGFLLAGDPA